MTDQETKARLVSRLLDELGGTARASGMMITFIVSDPPRDGAPIGGVELGVTHNECGPSGVIALLVGTASTIAIQRNIPIKILQLGDTGECMCPNCVAETKENGVVTMASICEVVRWTTAAGSAELVPIPYFAPATHVVIEGDGKSPDATAFDVCESHARLFRDNPEMRIYPRRSRP